jgi:hypothetical protein
MQSNPILSKARAKFIELYSRLIKIDESKDDAVYWNGENNLYPNEIELAILNSPTASLASKLMAKFIAGKGVIGNNDTVNSAKNYKLTDIIKLSSYNISKQNGVYFHIGYNIDESLKLQPVLDVLDYVKCRKAKENSEGNEGKFYYKDFTSVKSMFAKKSKEKWFYPFSKDENVIIAQIKADYKGEETDDLSVMLPYYRGQVYYMNLTPEFKYALSPFDSVYNDMDTEFRKGMYVNRQFRTGFLGKTYVITSGLDEEDEEIVKSDVQKWLGSENIGGVYHLSVGVTEDIDKIFKVGQVKAEFDEKMFSETVKDLRDNIIGAANNAPKQLIKSDDTLFGANSETYLEQKKFYDEQTEEERSKLEQTITYLGFPCIIENIRYEPKSISTGEVETVDVSDETKTAQANLRGSVGGVQGILAIQQSFANNLTDYGSAITILTEIYGFTNSVADALLGSPDKTPTNAEPTTI